MKLLRPKEVMQKLAVSKGKVYQMIRDGVIPSVNIDGCLRVPEEYLNAMIREQLAKRAGNKVMSKEELCVLRGGRAGRSEAKDGP